MFKGCYWLNLQSSFSHFRQVESSPTKLIRFLSAWIPFLIVDIPLQTCHGDSRFIQMQGERSDRKDMQWYCAGYILWGYKVRLGTQSEGHINWDWGETSSPLSYLLSLHVLCIEETSSQYRVVLRRLDNLISRSNKEYCMKFTA